MMNIATMIGTAGAIVLAIAWIPEILDIIKKKRSDLNRKFAVTTFIATTLLFTYSVMTKDWVFIAVNVFIGFEVALALYYEFIVEPKNRRSKRK